MANCEFCRKPRAARYQLIADRHHICAECLADYEKIHKVKFVAIPDDITIECPHCKGDQHCRYCNSTGFLKVPGVLENEVRNLSFDFDA